MKRIRLVRRNGVFLLLVLILLATMLDLVASAKSRKGEKRLYRDSHHDDDEDDEGSGDITLTDPDDDYIEGSAAELAGPTSLCERQRAGATSHNSSGTLLPSAGPAGGDAVGATGGAQAQRVVYIPQCTPAGRYRAHQCMKIVHALPAHASAPAQVECWCVHTVLGQEVKGTRRIMPKVPDCPEDQTEDISIKESRRPYTAGSASKGGGGGGEVSIDGSRKGKQKKPNQGEGGINGGVHAPEVSGGSPGKDSAAGGKVGVVLPSTKFLDRPGLIIGLVGGVVLSLVLALLLALFAVYRLRKKDEGSYVLDEPKSSPAIGCGEKSRDREFFA